MFGFLRDPSRWTLSDALAWQSRANPSKAFVQAVDGPALTFGEAEERAARLAAYFHQLGVRPGEPVVVLLHNDLDFVATWLGLGRLGAVAVMLNTELKGMFLQHQIEDSGARIAVVAPSLLPALEEIAGRLNSLELIVLAGEDGAAPASQGAPWSLAALSGWQDCSPYSGPLPRASDIACIMYTSGTTGPAKGVLMPHAHCFLYGLGTIDNLGVTEDDRYYVALPLYHANGLLMQILACLIAGATAILRERFSAQCWLTDVRRYRATLTNTLGVTAPFVFAQPASEIDRDHALRIIVAAPNPPELEEVWRTRFGIADVVSGFGMTEVNIPVWGRPGAAAPPSCAGLVYDRYFQVEIFDPDTDTILPPGTVGEIVVRPLAPFGFMAGYHRLPDKTCEAWRNLWFHTGDAGYMDENGYVFFVDRIRDCIRRRGHNISSFEIERAFLALEGVAEVAAFAVPSDITGGEDEVMVSLVRAQGATLTPEEASGYAEHELPRFARPRFIEIVPALPKTQTGKVQKIELRKRGIPSGAWDRDAQ